MMMNIHLFQLTLSDRKPNGSLGIHYNLHIGGKEIFKFLFSDAMYLVCPELDNLFSMFSLADSAKIKFG